MLPICVFYWCESHHSSSSFFLLSMLSKLCLCYLRYIYHIPVLVRRYLGHFRPMHSLETLRIFTKLPNRQWFGEQPLGVSCRLIGRFLGCRGRVVGSQVVCTRAETTLLSGMTTVHRAPLIASLRIPVHHIPANMWHLPAFLLLLLPKLRLVPIVSLFTLWFTKGFALLGLVRLWVWIFSLFPILTFYPLFL